MQDAYLYKNSMSYEADTVKLYGSLVVGAAGAVASFAGGGISGVVKETAAGQYSITLADRLNRLLFVSGMVVQGAISTVAHLQVLEAPATLQAGVKADRTFVIQLVDESLAAVNLASGAELKLEITVRRTSVGVYDA
jgi:hypothetical protein